MVLRDHFQRVTASGLGMNSNIQVKAQEGEMSKRLPPRSNRMPGVHNLGHRGQKSRTQRGGALS